MKILVTGAKGFIGKNLVLKLKNSDYTVFEYDVDSSENLLKAYCEECDFIFHLAGVNRPKDESEFTEGNKNFTERLLSYAMSTGRKIPVMLSSSIQAELDNPYGKSKLEAEKVVREYSEKTGSEVFIYRFQNVFGKWCRPNYNSVIATFCHNIANGLPIQVNDTERIMNLIYIDDITEEMLACLDGKANKSDGFCYVKTVYTKKLGEIADIIKSFEECRYTLAIPDQSDGFIKKLYSTFLSYLPKEKFTYPLKMNCDNRGSFTEFIRTSDRGQFSVNISKPHIVKGNHWHNTKHEIFLIVSGNGVIRFRNPDSDEVIEIYASGDKLDPVIIPPGYTHNIENTGDSDMVTVMWANEVFDKDNPDTYYLEV